MSGGYLALMCANIFMGYLIGSAIASELRDLHWGIQFGILLLCCILSGTVVTELFRLIGLVP